MKKFFVLSVLSLGLLMPAITHADEDLLAEDPMLSVEIVADSYDEAVTDLPETEVVAAPLPFDGEEAAVLDYFQPVKEMYNENPSMWNVILSLLGAVGAFGGFKGVKGGFTALADQSSPGEVAGSMIIIGGVFTIANALALAFSLSFLTTNLMVGGVLACICGLSIAAGAHENRTKN